MEQRQAMPGNTVQIEYTATLDDGRVVATSKQEQSKSVAFTLGKGQVIRGLEKTVLGMSPGESRMAQIPPQEAFGARNADKLINVKMDRFPPEVDITPGAHLSLRYKDGTLLPAQVTAVQGDEVVLDTNHPLAGRSIVLEVKLLSVN